MTSSIEQALLAFFLSQLDGETITHGTGENAIEISAVTISGRQVQFLAATSGAKIAEMLPKVVIACAEVAHEVEGLYSARVEIHVATPRQVAGITDAAHRAIVAALRAEMVPENLAELNDALMEAGVIESNRWFEQGPLDQHTDGHWITALRYDPFAITV